MSTADVCMSAVTKNLTSCSWFSSPLDIRHSSLIMPISYTYYGDVRHTVWQPLDTVWGRHVCKNCCIYLLSHPACANVIMYIPVDQLVANLSPARFWQKSLCPSQKQLRYWSIGAWTFLWKTCSWQVRQWSVAITTQMCLLISTVNLKLAYRFGHCQFCRVNSITAKQYF